MDRVLNIVAPGAIVVEWNIAQPDGIQGGAGMWDSHIRLGGGKAFYPLPPCADASPARGTELELAQCPSSGAGGYDDCFAAFLALHITQNATAYLEVKPHTAACKKF